MVLLSLFLTIVGFDGILIRIGCVLFFSMRSREFRIRFKGELIFVMMEDGTDLQRLLFCNCNPFFFSLDIKNGVFSISII